METVYSASVVGGGMGGQLSLRALSASSRYELAAAADLRPDVCQSLEASFPGLRTFSSHRQMFAECPTDVVCVSTYPSTHEEVAMDALQLPLKGIVVEKPLGPTAAAGRRIFQAIQERGLPMAVPHGMLVRKVPTEIIERVQNGEIGDLKLVTIECRGWDIINAGIHWLNFFVNLTGPDPIESVLATCDATSRTYRDGMQVETVAVTSAVTRSGVRVVMHTGDETPVGRADKATLFRVIGTRGQIEFWGWEGSYLLQNEAHPAPALITPFEEPTSAHQRHLDRLAGEIDRRAPEYGVVESSLLALEICEAAYLSSRHRCSVRFPLESFPPPAPVDWNPGEPYGGAGGGRDGRQFS